MMETLLELKSKLIIETYMHSIDLRMSACVTVRDRNRDEKGTEGWTGVHERS